MGGLMGGGGGGKSGGGSHGGLSPFDLGAIHQAFGQDVKQIHNRYSQLGIGTPSGNAATAAAGNTNLMSSGPSTMEQQDIGQIPSEQGGAIGQEQALEGLIQTANVGSQALGGIGTSPLTPALQQLASQGSAPFQQGDTGGFGAGFNSPTST